MPRYLISGLCLQGNKGGPALALSLMNNIKAHIPDAEFVLAVPGHEREWPHEQEWAKHYNLTIIKSLSLSQGQIPRLREWWKTLKKCDALIQMSAICYLGPPAGSGSWVSTIASIRWLDFFLTKMAKRPLYAWTQSYGPFSSTAVRLLGRLDLSYQKIIFCRGRDCLNEVKALLPNCIALDFPDVAISLPFDKKWGQEYLSNIYSIDRNLVTLSPSSVMFSKSTGHGVKNEHVLQQVKITEQLIGSGYSVLLVPHTLRPDSNDPKECDLAVCHLVCKLVSNPKLRLLDKDLSPIELKSIISNAEIHIGARYHSLVAALSAYVPAISISWHPKYRDLMRSYNIEEFILEGAGVDKFSEYLELLSSSRMKFVELLREQQLHLSMQVEENGKLFSELLKVKN